jgi:hypothetical protein
MYGALKMRIAQAERDTVHGAARRRVYFAETIRLWPTDSPMPLRSDEMQTLVYAVYNGDIADSFILHCPDGADTIERVELLVGPYVISRISGAALQAHQQIIKNDGLVDRHDALVLPFPRVYPEVMRQNPPIIHVTVKNVRTQCEYDMITATHDLPDVLVDIIREYIGSTTSAHAEVYARTQLLELDQARSLLDMRETQGMREYGQVKETISAGYTNYVVDLGRMYGRIAHGLMFFFTDGLDSAYVDALDTASVEDHGYSCAFLSNFGAWVADKNSHGLRVPSRPIYTITFDIQDPCEHEASGHLKISSSTKLRLTLRPHHRPLTLTVIAITHNSLQMENDPHTGFRTSLMRM